MSPARPAYSIGQVRGRAALLRPQRRLQRVPLEWIGLYHNIPVTGRPPVAVSEGWTYLGSDAGTAAIEYLSVTIIEYHGEDSATVTWDQPNTQGRATLEMWVAESEGWDDYLVGTGQDVSGWFIPDPFDPLVAALGNPEAVRAHAAEQTAARRARTGHRT